MDEPRTQRRFLTRRRFLAAGLIAGVTAYLDFAHIGSAWLRLAEDEVPLRFFPAHPGLRIAHLSDLHRGPDVSDKHIAGAVRLALAQNPDLIALTGDFITGPLHDPEGYAALLRPLAHAAPCFACPGNHDGISGGPERDCARVGAMLESAGIRFLRNRTETLVVRGAPLKISGLGDLWANENLPGRCLTPVSATEPEDTRTLLLNHNPDARAALMAHRWSLMLSGHTHAGQIGIPWIARRLAPVKDKSHIEGLREREGRLICISRGVGNLHGVRIFCRPDVRLLTVAA